MGIEADCAGIFVFDQQLRGEEGFLEIVAAEAQVLIETQRLLAVQMDVEQLA